MSSSPSRPKLSSFNLRIGTRMKQLRVERGLTLSEFGRQLGVSFQQVQKYERGLNSVTVEKLLRASNILGVSLETFWKTPDESREIIPQPGDRGAVALVKAYKGITNPMIRQKLLEVVKKIAEADALINGR